MGCLIMDIITQACSNRTYNILKGLKIELKINTNPYNFPIEGLFSMAARQNKKRGFLFVSQLLGKHIPVNPYSSLLAGSILAVRFLEEVYQKDLQQFNYLSESLKLRTNEQEAYLKLSANPLELPEEVILIGFAETATALGHSVFDSFKDKATYIHTTREQIPQLGTKINFEEEHCHATSHRVYALDQNIFVGDKPIVLVDDEITTGKTALNIIEAIQKKYPRKKYVVISLLDWRTKDHQMRFRELEAKLGIEIHTVSLVAGEIVTTGEPIENFEEAAIQYPLSNLKVAKEDFYNLALEPFVVDVASVNSLGQSNQLPYLSFTGRFGMTSPDNHLVHFQGKKIGKALAGLRTGSKTLCLGTGEFMYFPMLIAAHMGNGVKYQSTTRSPIHPCSRPDYAINSAYTFPSPDDSEVTNFLYNVRPGEYDDIFIFFERKHQADDLQQLYEVLTRLAPNVKIIYCIDEFSKIQAPDPMGSYPKEDVVFLLKNLNGLLQETCTEDREEAIQGGRHYSEMLPVEYRPSDDYIKLFYSSLKDSTDKLAVAVGTVAEKILARRGRDLVLVSLARAGTPIGILIKRYLAVKYGLEVPHYSISIIRGKGIDQRALNYIIQNHYHSQIQFIDGWTGKGAITQVLADACLSYKNEYGIELDEDLAVLADPGYCVATYGTREDFLIPSACLNSTVSGLVSRTVQSDKLVGAKDFHGAKYYPELMGEDVSNYFVEAIMERIPAVADNIKANLLKLAKEDNQPTWQGLRDIKGIQKEFGIQDINLIKPGVGETTRVLLRRVPWKILIQSAENPDLQHIQLLAKEKGVPIQIYPQMAYSCCGLIKPLRGEA